MKEIDGNELRTDDPLAVSAIDNLIESTESETSVPEQLSSKSVKMDSSRLELASGVWTTIE